MTLYLPELVPPVTACFLDPDPRVRYKACEALFNIIKVARSSALIFFKDIFTSTAKVCVCVYVCVCVCVRELCVFAWDLGGGL